MALSPELQSTIRKQFERVANVRLPGGSHVIVVKDKRIRKSQDAVFRRLCVNLTNRFLKEKA